MTQPSDQSTRTTNWVVLGGFLLQLATVFGGGVFWLAADRSKADQFQAIVTSQVADLRASITSGLADIHQQIQGLPDQRARIDQLERRIAAIEDRWPPLDTRLLSIERRLIEMQSSLDRQGVTDTTTASRTKKNGKLFGD